MLEQLSVDDLRQRLKEREQTVATLTGYLEQAAAKLNTMQAKPSAGKPPQAFDAEMVHRQMELVRHLQEAVEEWEELQAPATLARLSTQLDKLRNTIVDGLSAQAAPPSSFSMDAFPPGEQASGLSFSMPKDESDKKPGNALEAWEALKAEMLKDEVSPVEDEEEPCRIDLKEELEVLVNRPERMDPHSIDREAWQEAVDAREKYMISLIRALRVVESRRRGTPDWDSLTEAPVQLRDEVAQLSLELQQSLRNAEVEQSIERARLSRQESLIAQQHREIEKARKKQGYPNKPGSGNAPVDAQQGRWLKFLGRTEADEE
jgi:hypothetical protein